MRTPRHVPLKLNVVILLLAAAWGRAAVAAGRDTVLLKNRQPAAGLTVLREGYDKVEADRDGDGKADETFPADAVTNVTYHDAPMSFRQGAASFRLGRFKEAAEYFSKALSEKDVRSFWLQQHANYFIGECRRQLAQKNKKLLAEARQAYERVIETVPDGRLVPFAIRGIGLCRMAEGKLDAARREFEKLSAQDKFGKTWTLRAKLLLAQIHSKAGKHKEAQKLCDEVMKMTRAAHHADLRREATRTRADVLTAAGEYAKAREIFLQIARETDERDVKAKARLYNAIGDCFLGEKRTREALLAYLRVRVLYFKDRDELPRALYGAARCFTILRKSKEADELVTLLMKEHPDSPWTAKAARESGRETSPKTGKETR